LKKANKKLKIEQVTMKVSVNVSDQLIVKIRLRIATMARSSQSSLTKNPLYWSTSRRNCQDLEGEIPRISTSPRKADFIRTDFMKWAVIPMYEWDNETSVHISVVIEMG
jgi:hypothetical protein